MWMDRIRRCLRGTWNMLVPQPPLRWKLSIHVDPAIPCTAEILQPGVAASTFTTCVEGLLTLSVKRHGITLITLRADGYHPTLLQLDARNASPAHHPSHEPTTLSIGVALTPTTVPADPVGCMWHWSGTGAVVRIRDIKASYKPGYTTMLRST